MIVAKPHPCTCGTRMPWHLIALGITTHVCACERRWISIDGGARVKLDGTEVNSFARYDRGGPPQCSGETP